MSTKFKKYIGYFIMAVVLIGLGKQCHREAPVSGTKEYFPPKSPPRATLLFAKEKHRLVLGKARPGPPTRNLTFGTVPT